MRKCSKTIVQRLLLSFLFLLSIVMATAQNRLSPCDKMDYELYASQLAKWFNPLASQQYIVVDGQPEKYALQVIKGSLLERPKHALVFKDATGEYTMNSDSVCQMKISSLLRFAVLSSSHFVRKKIGFLKTCFFFDLQDGAQYALRKEEMRKGSLIDVLEQSCVAVKENKPELIRQLFPQIDSLTQHFKSYELPESWEVQVTEDYMKGQPCINFSTHYGGFKLIFINPESDVTELRKKYERRFQEMAKWVFVRSHVLDFNEQVYICVDLEKPTEEMRYSYLYEKYYIHMTEEELAEEKFGTVLKNYLDIQPDYQTKNPAEGTTD